MVVARKRPKGRLVRARALVLCANVVASALIYIFLASGLPYSLSVSAGFQAAGLIWFAVVFILLLLPIAWKVLDEELARYRIARSQVIRGRRLILLVVAGLAVTIAVSLGTYWYSAGRSGIDVARQLALPISIGLAVFQLASFWIVDRQIMRHIMSAPRPVAHQDG